jgi:p-cumate 2,3-dioxygenase alpha subunit
MTNHGDRRREQLVPIEPVQTETFVVDDRERGTFRVHRSSMTSAVVLEAEREQIFDRCWLYVGHESEIPTPGDFRRRTVNQRPLILVRGRDGDVTVLYNSCTHRGATVCREDAGNARHFQCLYHAWTFDTGGALLSTPGKDSYPPDFDREERALRRPAKVDAYRGFVFVCFDPEAPQLDEYLAGAKEHLDLIADQSDVGMTVVSGTNRYGARANWKLMVENSIDGYHAFPVHRTWVDYMTSLADGESPLSGGIDPGRAYDLGNGHTVIESAVSFGKPVAKWTPLYGEDAKADIAAIRRRLVDRHGEDRAARIAEMSRNLFIFPNLIVNDRAAVTIRSFEPDGPDSMRIDAWALAPAEETTAQLERRLDSYLTFFGPGGFATPDDIEVLEECQAGFATLDALEFSDMSRGMFSDQPTQNEELQMRVFWRAWDAHMRNLPMPDPVCTPEASVRAGSRS